MMAGSCGHAFCSENRQGVGAKIIQGESLLVLYTAVRSRNIALDSMWTVPYIRQFLRVNFPRDESIYNHNVKACSSILSLILEHLIQNWFWKLSDDTISVGLKDRWNLSRYDERLRYMRALLRSIISWIKNMPKDRQRKLAEEHVRYSLFRLLD